MNKTYQKSYCMTTSHNISIILPIYNVEKYLVRCLDSIIYQTYSNIEILLVNDGSPDGCGAICDEYTTKDSRIKVFHIPNGGVAKARLLGVENSSGEYIVFVDPDDWLPKDAVEILYSNINKDVDIVIGSFTRYIGKDALPVDNQQECVISQDEYLKGLMTESINWAPWAKIYKRDLFLSDTFHVTKRGQDFLMNLDIACRINQVRLISTSVYNYNIDISIEKKKGNFDVYCTIIAKLTEVLDKFSIKKKYLQELNSIAFTFLIRSVIKGYDINNQEHWVIDAKSYAKSRKLRFRDKIFLISLDCKILRNTIYFIYSNPVGQYLRKQKAKI